MFGFIEFGEDTEGVILDDYDSDDVFANFGRLSMAIHVALAYPVILFPAQQSLLHSLIMPIYRRLRGGTVRSNLAMFEGSRLVKVETVPNTATDDDSSNVHSPLLPTFGGRQRTISMETLDAEDIPLPLRVASAVTITLLTAVIAIMLPQAEIVFGYELSN